jgi:microcystin-dependent protein
MTKQGGAPLAPGDIPGALAECMIRYNAANARWELLNPAASSFTTGDVKTTLKTTADAGWVMMNDGTLGDASSGATTRANADTQALFTLLWTNVSNTNCPVSGGRGASAAADFASHKTIALPKMHGRALASAGAGSGLTARNLGDAVGTEANTLFSANLPPHQHNVPNVPGAGGATLGANPGGNVPNNPGTLVTDNGPGASAPINNMQPTSFLNFTIKL